MKTISRGITILGLAALMGGIPLPIKAQSGAALLNQNSPEQSNDSGIRRFFSPVDNPQNIREYNQQNSLNTDDTLVYNVGTACAEARDNLDISGNPNQAVLNDGFSSAGRQLTTRAIVNCSDSSALFSSNSSASLTKDLSNAPLPNYQPFYVIRFGDTTQPTYRQRGDAMIQTPIVRF